MKRFRSFGLAFLGMMLGMLTMHSRAEAQPGMAVSLQTFYDELDPYGQWVDDPEYGYVWVPEVADPDFRPYYTRGHWAMTEYGNMWVSDYDWGWAPFHYGRWAFTDYYGWVWLPDTTWGPAWVSWRTGGEYYGWAPLGPNISIDLYVGSRYSCPDFWWTFLPRPRLFSVGFYSYCAPFSRNVTIIRSTTYITNVYSRGGYRCIAGPSYREVGRYVGRVPRYQVNNVYRPGRTVVRNNRINIYRPQVNRSGNNRPSRMISRDGYRQGRYDNQNRNYRPGGRSGIADRNDGRFNNRDRNANSSRPQRGYTPDNNGGRSNGGRYNNDRNNGRTATSPRANGQGRPGNNPAAQDRRERTYGSNGADRNTNQPNRPQRRYSGPTNNANNNRDRAENGQGNRPQRQYDRGRTEQRSPATNPQRRQESIRRGDNSQSMRNQRQAEMNRRPQTRPERQAMPQRQASPPRQASPQRQSSPQRQASPQRNNSGSRPSRSYSPPQQRSQSARPAPQRSQPTGNQRSAGRSSSRRDG